MGIKLLSDRAVISVSGPEAETFLNGLLTISTLSLAEHEMVWAALLTPQGKIMFDGLLGRVGDTFYLDCMQASAADFVKRLSMYKLRAAVEISDASEEFIAGFSINEPDASLGHVFKDMRHTGFGYRVLVTKPQSASIDADDTSYHQLRIGLTVPEIGQDYQGGEIFPHDIGMDLLGGVDFKKGCYVGQEVVSRMSHKTIVRKRPVQARFETEASSKSTPGVTLELAGKKIGAIGSTSGNFGIAIVRLDKISLGATLECEGKPVKLKIPDWANYEFGGSN